MAKILKIFYSLFGLILLSIFIMVMGVTQGYLDMPSSYDWFGWDLDRIPGFLDPGLYYYFYWVAVALAALTIIGILVVIFYPRTYTEVRLSKNQGSLLLKKSAIESYVRTAIQNAGLMTKPNVTATLYKRKFKIDVTGRLDSRVAVSDQIRGIKEGIDTGFKEFFGIDKPVNLKVYVKDIAQTEKKYGKGNRVE
ncbi:alkaline shock response membrane anchor protein AmaP [Streptococcus porcinus]|uniref:Membrane protein n=1 Tax=Streptococcus porcinus TaxID=1340 RepID=A0A4V0H2T0_STRPO|nr:alkaline shock response membrane anchor protein AmaP [Streptococcus porcinus]VTT43404.1 membrane protein [Streptococcus porcinus]VTT44854.1 membrane protein [Streptococcus porcinus]